MHTPTWIAPIVVVLALAGTAVAQPAPPADPKAEAKAHAEVGTRLFDAQQYSKAAEEYQQAYLLDPQPTFLYASAQALRLGGDCTRALRAYNAYLRTNPSAMEKDKTQKNIQRCEQDLKDHPPVEESKVVPVTTPVNPVTPPSPPAPPPGPVLGDSAPSPWTSDWIGHAMVGGGVLVAATGTVLFLQGRGTIADNSSAKTYDQFAAGRGDLDTAKLKQTIGVSAMAVGGVLLVGGIVHYAVHTRGGHTRNVSASVAHDHAILVMTGTF
jgi:tetratricopeptide (TPR) repeat protein